MYGIMLIPLKDAVSNINSLDIKEKNILAPQFVATILFKVIPIYNTKIQSVYAPTNKANTKFKILVFFY